MRERITELALFWSDNNNLIPFLLELSDDKSAEVHKGIQLVTDKYDLSLLRSWLHTRRICLYYIFLTFNCAVYCILVEFYEIP